MDVSRNPASIRFSKWGSTAPSRRIQGADTMTKLAIKGLLAITTALWLPAHGAGNTAPWLPESQKENRHDDSRDSVAENSSVLLPTRVEPGDSR